MAGEDQKAVRAVIRGRVQAVFFRGWTHDQASRLGLAGWVRNRRDGSVEALFAGPAAAVDQMLRLCRQGPPAAIVGAVEAYPAEPPAKPGFHTRSTT